jgi:hypothetical protein
LYKLRYFVFKIVIVFAAGLQTFRGVALIKRAKRNQCMMMISFLPFLFVVEMEMKILGFRHFLISMTQTGFKSLKLR